MSDIVEVVREYYKHPTKNGMVPLTVSTLFALLVEVDRMRSELGAARRDAERYRWLRGNLHTGDEDNLPPLIYLNDGGRYGEPTSETLDAAIDAAIGESK